MGRPKGSGTFTSETARAASKAQKGIRKRNTLAVQTVFAEVFSELQEDKDKPYALAKWAKQNPEEFYKLSTKLIPVQLTGEDGDPIKVKITGMKIT